MSREKNEDIWIACPECKSRLKKDHIATHMNHIHRKKIEDFDESSIKVLPKKEQRQKKPIHFSLTSIAVIVVILVVIIAAVVFVLSKPSDSLDNNGNSNTSQWLDDYIPVHSVGTEANNFWINFPVGNPSVGQSVVHKTWITEDLEEKPVVFVCHRTGCASCTPQADRVKAFRQVYGEDAIFYDLDDPYSGGAAEEILQKYHDGFYYDPNGSPNYIALTGIFTLIKEGSEVKIGWHSWEGNVGDSEMESWIQDCIYYYNVNSGV